MLANSAAFWLRFDGEVPDDFAALRLRVLPWLVVVRLLSFIPFRLFEGLWKYTSLWDLRNIVLGVAVSTAAFYPIAVMNAGAARYPYSIYVIDAVLLVPDDWHQADPPHLRRGAQATGGPEGPDLRSG